MSDSESVVVYHFNHILFLDFVCCLMGQHAALKKYQRSSQLAETIKREFSCDGGQNPCLVLDDAPPVVNKEL